MSLQIEKDSEWNPYDAYEKRTKELEQQLSEREKQNVMLREAIIRSIERMCFAEPWSAAESDIEFAKKALAATADLAGLVVCDAKPVAFSYHPYISAEYDHEKGFWSDSPFYSDHVPEGAKNIVTLYARRKEK